MNPQWLTAQLIRIKKGLRLRGPVKNMLAVTKTCQPFSS